MRMGNVAALAVAGMFVSIGAMAQTKWDLPAGYPATNFHTINMQKFADAVKAGSGGKLEINATKMDAAMANLDDLKALFTSTSSDAAATGFGWKIKSFADGLIAERCASVGDIGDEVDPHFRVSCLKNRTELFADHVHFHFGERSALFGHRVVRGSQVHVDGRLRAVRIRLMEFQIEGTELDGADVP